MKKQPNPARTDLESVRRRVDWTTPPNPLFLEEDRVHIWLRRFDPGPSGLEAVRGSLSPSEAGRAERFRFDRDRDRYAFARGTLRGLLGRYLGLPPEAVRLETTRLGKPYLHEQLNGRELCFNLSHSGDLTIYAFSLGRAVGIDLERLQSLPELEKMAEAYFSLREKETLGRIAPEARLRLFLQYWTRKEAYLKACGKGLAVPLDEVDTASVSRSEGAWTPFPAGSKESLQGWYLLGLSPTPESIAAVVLGERSRPAGSSRGEAGAASFPVDFFEIQPEGFARGS